MQNNLGFYLEKSGMTNVEFARRTGITPVSVYRYKKGLRTPPIGLAQLMAKELGIPVDKLFEPANKNDRTALQCDTVEKSH